VISGPPYNLPTRSFQERGNIRHANFVEAFGEMSPDEFVDFLTVAFSLYPRYSRDGALRFYFGDWAGISLQISARACLLFKNGKAVHTNNVQLGRFGRNRANIWLYAGANSFRQDWLEELSLHPTVKPVAMIADALKMFLDVTTSCSIPLPALVLPCSLPSASVHRRLLNNPSFGVHDATTRISLPSYRASRAFALAENQLIPSSA